MTLLGPLVLVYAASGLLSGRIFDVVVSLEGGANRQTLKVHESQSILSAVERAGLLPTSDCRRGRCLSCAAKIVSGAPYSLRVASDTALCDLAHARGLVLLCSAFATGPGLEIELGAEAEAYKIQHEERWRSPTPRTPPMGRTPVQWRPTVEGASLLERSFSMPSTTAEREGRTTAAASTAAVDEADEAEAAADSSDGGDDAAANGGDGECPT